MKYVIVCGYVSSGSSAMVDLLKEYRGVADCGTEIRIIKDPYGIIDLEEALVKNWDLIRSTAAINDFLSLCQICSRPGGSGGKKPFSKAGLNYSGLINNQFMELTEQYIDSLSEFEYNEEYYYSKFKKSHFRFVLDRISYGIERKTGGTLQIVKRDTKQYFAHPAQNEFYDKTREYLSSVFEPFKKRGNRILLLDQASNPTNALQMKKYFSDVKIIVVDRDIRDMYISSVRGKPVLGEDKQIENARNFARIQKVQREESEKDKDILYVKFEDIVYKTKEVQRLVEQFLGIGESDHEKPHTYFTPEKSVNNTMKWKRYPQLEYVMNYFKEETPELCYPYDSLGKD